MHAALLQRELGLVAYGATYDAMRDFTRTRTPDSADELWLCQHPAVYTLGLAGKSEHLIQTTTIPVVQTDRGGQITYHGPGQLMAYPLLDLRRRGYFVKEYVFRLEEALIRTLMDVGITGHRVRGAPGIYVRMDAPSGHAMMHLTEADLAQRPDIAKIAALGIKVSQRGSYHGLALNVALDLSPFAAINPCGYAGLRTVDVRSLGFNPNMAEVQTALAQHLVQRLA